MVCRAWTQRNRITTTDRVQLLHERQRQIKKQSEEYSVELQSYRAIWFHEYSCVFKLHAVDTGHLANTHTQQQHKTKVMMDAFNAIDLGTRAAAEQWRSHQPHDMRTLGENGKVLGAGSKIAETELK
jgi:hypothetical protein